MNGLNSALALKPARSRHARLLTLALLFITITATLPGHAYVQAQGVTTEEPPGQFSQNTAQPFPNAAQPARTTAPPAQDSHPALPAGPDAAPSSDLVDLSAIPHATPLASDRQPDHPVIQGDTQSLRGDLYLVAGDAEVDYKDHVLRADTITYNRDTGDVVAEGHVQLTGGENDEYLQASHGAYNVRTQTGQFYDVVGSVEMRSVPAPTVLPTATLGGPPASRDPGFTSPNPFLFEGRVVVKTGPESYVVYNGSVTSCLLPHPDWQLFSSKFTIRDGEARATGSTFRLLGIPLLFLPVVSHPTNTDQRESGLLIPVFGYSSASKDTGSKGFTFGEQLYLTLGRSADLTVGTLYYSLRGFSENGTVRYRGPGDDFFNAHFSALQDRGFTPLGGVYTNQGGEDVTSSFRYRLSPTTRVAGDAEYLSSYVYREAFTDNFNQAVSSDITSILYATHEKDGFTLDGRVDRYQGLKVVPIGAEPGAEVKIFHVPSIDFSGVDHGIPGTPLLWSVSASAAGLKRVQPNFVSAGITERVDLRPEISLPLSFEGWRVLASIAGEETFYSRSRQTPYGANTPPVELTTPVNRADVDVKVDLRPPVVERTFTVPPALHWLLGDEVRHTIEPALVYRDVKGINNFLSVLRFDDTDLVSDTDELQYGLTQHLYFRPSARSGPRGPAEAVRRKAKPGCAAVPAASATGATPAGSPQAPTPTATVPSTSGLPDAPDVLNPTPEATTDANGIPDASASAPDTPTRTHPRSTNASSTNASSTNASSMGPGSTNPGKRDPCAPTGAAAALPSQQEWFSWMLAQKFFFEPTFGGAAINSRRNIFQTTLDLSGVAFLTEARNISPLISRMRFRSSGHTDVEWDFDYDTGASKFTSQNIFLDARVSSFFGGVSYARLNAPGRFYTEDIETDTLVGSATSNFNQMRLLVGYGTPSRPGFSVAGNTGLDLSTGSVQYATVQSSYNWNCCGLTVEYRKFELGSVRDENAYRFNFTLANIGSAGNLRRTEQIF